MVFFFIPDNDDIQKYEYVKCNDLTFRGKEVNLDEMNKLYVQNDRYGFVVNILKKNTAMEKFQFGSLRKDGVNYILYFNKMARSNLCAKNETATRLCDDFGFHIIHGNAVVSFGEPLINNSFVFP